MFENHTVSSKESCSKCSQNCTNDCDDKIHIKTEIDENVTIPSGTNGLSVGTIRVGAGYSVTVQGNWRIV